MRPGRHRLLLTVHIGTAVAVLGADLALLTLGAAGLRGADPVTVYPAAHLLGQWLVSPLAVTSLASGTLLAATTSFKPWRHGWVAIKASTTLVLTGLLLAVLVPGLGRTADAATANPPQVTGTQRLLYVLAPSGAAALLTVNLALGVYKPRKLRHAPATSHAALPVRW